MRHRAVTAVLSVVALAATVYLAVDRRPVQVQRDHPASNDNAVVETSSSPGNAAHRAGSSSPVSIEAAATDLRNMSPTFRNSTFLIAIRSAGFYCDGVAAAHESTDGVWLASCTEKLGYALNIRDVDQLDVRPVAHYFDSVSPSPQLRERLDRGRPPEALELERLRQ